MSVCDILSVAHTQGHYFYQLLNILIHQTNFNNPDKMMLTEAEIKALVPWTCWQPLSIAWFSIFINTLLILAEIVYLWCAALMFFILVSKSWTLEQHVWNIKDGLHIWLGPELERQGFGMDRNQTQPWPKMETVWCSMQKVRSNYLSFIVVLFIAAFQWFPNNEAGNQA